jgi:hypothetical protein
MALLVAGVACGCDGNASNPRQSAPATLASVADVGPYLCDFVPEQSLRMVTGTKAPIDDTWAGPQTDNGLCLARVAGQEALLGIDWSYNDGPEVLRRQQRGWADNSPHPLPHEFGEGLAVIRPTFGGNPRPNYVIALFRCGKKKPWISIDFAPVVRGRDAVQDMFDFMRIAEKRFGEIHKCTPRPS